MTILLTELGWTWTEGRPSHSDTLECAWLSMLCDNDGTMSGSFTGACTSTLSEFLRTVKEIEANLCFAIFGKNSKIQNGCHFWGGENFLKIAEYIP